MAITRCNLPSVGQQRPSHKHRRRERLRGEFRSRGERDRGGRDMTSEEDEELIAEGLQKDASDDSEGEFRSPTPQNGPTANTYCPLPSIAGATVGIGGTPTHLGGATATGGGTANPSTGAVAGVRGASASTGVATKFGRGRGATIGKTPGTVTPGPTPTASSNFSGTTSRNTTPPGASGTSISTSGTPGATVAISPAGTRKGATTNVTGAKSNNPAPSSTSGTPSNTSGIPNTTIAGSSTGTSSGTPSSIPEQRGVPRR